MAHKMKNSFLIDTVTGKRYNLTELAEWNGGEILIGRIGKDNQIGLGIETDSETDPNAARKVSRYHATIRYLGRFYIRDHSTNATKVNDSTLRGEEGLLAHRDKILFGTYGPLIYEEDEG